MKKLIKNKKTGKTYTVLHWSAIDTTNKRDGTNVIIYTDHKNVFVRELREFNEKFILI
jgi:hypothetical protein